jgi:hypothetical protein
MDAPEIVIKWVKGVYSKEARPKAYLMRNKRPVRQLTFAELSEFASQGAIDDVKVVGWLRQQKDWKMLNDSMASDLLPVNDAVLKPYPAIEKKVAEKATKGDVVGELKPRSPELYAYLESIYKKTKWLNV